MANPFISRLKAAPSKDEREYERRMAGRQANIGDPSLNATAEARLLDYLRSSLSTSARDATFACGGKIPLRNGRAHSYSNFDQKIAVESNEIEPIQVRFGESGRGLNLVFPLNPNESNAELVQLISACQPATFGLGGEDVLDENYRKAGKLDEQDFTTSFCPYKSGIVDIVTQMLLPQLKHGKHTRSIKAELYKLNVYSAPSGKFMAHVDTPRSEKQTGSLVVSLPVDHEGGQLAVRNAGREIVFDWSRNANVLLDGTLERPCINWAAFYSDCEHEVFEVTAGHRITLTYNLYVTRGAGHLAGATMALDPTQLPLYEVLGRALHAPGFLTQGRVLAIYLSHSYVHTSKRHNFLPESLKGSDWSLFETVRAHGLKCKLVSVHSRENYKGENQRHYADSSFPPFYQLDGEVEDDYDWGTAMPMRKVTWLKPESSTNEEPQTAFMAYGNEAELEVQYSHAAMLIRVPPFSLRGGNEDAQSKSVYANIRRDERTSSDGLEYDSDGDTIYSEPDDEDEPDP